MKKYKELNVPEIEERKTSARDRQGLKCDEAICDGTNCDDCLFSSDNIKEFEAWEKETKTK